METKTIKLNGFDLNLIKTNKFKSVSVNFSFRRKLIKEELSKRSLIAEILLESSFKYPSKKDLTRAKEENYGQRISSQNYNTGCHTTMEFNTSYVNPKYTDCKDNKPFLDLIMEVIFSPHIDSSFNEEKFNLVLKELKEYMVSEKENTNKYALKQALESADKGEVYTLNNFGYMEDLEGLTRESLYDYYQDMIENDILDITVVGDIDFIEFENYFSSLKREAKSEDNNFEYVQKVKENFLELKEEYDSFQSKLVMIFKFSDFSSLETKLLVTLYRIILGSGTSSKLFLNVREKHSLCYSIGANTIPVSNYMTVRAGINKNDYEKAKEVILAEVADMKSNISIEEFEAAKKLLRNSILLDDESVNGIVSSYLSEKNYNYLSKEEKLLKLENATIDDLYKLANKIKLDTIFLLEGVR